MGLALSGGGLRALAYHAGTLKGMAEHGVLQQIEHVSTVSGGTIFAGLVFQMSGNTWPTNEYYLEHVLPSLREAVVGLNFASAFAKTLLQPQAWKHLLTNRPAVAADLISKHWEIDGTLQDLPDRPLWNICGTTMETGKGWRFSKERMGDWRLGYVRQPRFPLSQAIAISAAFPFVFGPFKLKTSDYAWVPSGYVDHSIWTAPYERGFDVVHILDGGVYENLALEPMMYQFPGTLRADVDFLYVSDASMEISDAKYGGWLGAKRLKRMLEVVSDQTTLLRRRGLFHSLSTEHYQGAFAKITMSPRSFINELVRLANMPGSKIHWNNVANASTYALLNDNDIDDVARLSTFTIALTEPLFERLVEHGRQSARCRLAAFL